MYVTRGSRDQRRCCGVLTRGGVRERRGFGIARCMHQSRSRSRRQHQRSVDEIDGWFRGAFRDGSDLTVRRHANCEMRRCLTLSLTQQQQARLFGLIDLFGGGLGHTAQTTSARLLVHAVFAGRNYEFMKRACTFSPYTMNELLLRLTCKNELA